MDKENFLRSTIENLAQSYYDRFIERDADRKLSAGIEIVAIRRELWNCCDWCAKLAGTYTKTNGKWPDGIFARHQNCRCMVTTKTSRSGYTDVWSKKEYESQREARLAREEEILRENNIFEKYQQKVRMARDADETFVDATEYWKSKEKLYPARTRKIAGKYEYRGTTYNTADRGIKPEPGEQERDFAEWWAETFGGDIQYIPIIKIPQKIKTPDYLIDGIYYDLKSPTGDGKWVISHQADEAKGQANKIFIDLSGSFLKNRKDEIMRQAKNMFLNEKYSWLETVIITADKELLYVFEKI